MLAELKPFFDGRKSFYGKAVINGDTLYSYGVPVARGTTLLPKWDHSATTLRHVKEYLRQLGEPPMTKAELTKKYLNQG